MAEGKYGFGGIGAGGGIANLVAAPKVNPIRSGQFAPTPQRRLTPKKDPKKQIIGALAGAASPFLAQAGLKGLGKIPGLEGLLFQSDVETKEDFGIAEPTTGTETSTDPYVLEQKKLRQRVEAALPSTKLPRQKTLLGKGLAELLTYAPALALSDEDDGSVASYIAAASAGKKLEGALDQTRLKAYLDRETKRGEKLADVGNFERKLTHSSVLQKDGTWQPISRTALVSPDKSTRYVLSQGRPEIDFIYDKNGEKVPVPKGQYFIREDLTLDDTDPGKPKEVKLWDTVHRKIGYGTIQFTTGPKGRNARILLRDPSKRDGTMDQTTAAQLNYKYGDQWVPYDQELAALNDLEDADKDLIERVEGRFDREQSTIAAVRIAADLLPIAIEAEKNPAILTDLGASVGFIDSVVKNVDTLYQLINDSGRSVNNIIYEQGKKSNSSASMGALLNASNNYNSVVSDPAYIAALQSKTLSQAQTDLAEASSKTLITALRRVQQRAIDQGASDSFTSLDLSNASFQNIIMKRALLATGQLRLAYAAAAADGQTGTSLSDKDVTNYLSQLGFGSDKAKVVGQQIAGFVKSRLQSFDDGGEYRRLSDSAVSNSPIAKKATNNYLISVYRVNPDDLNIIQSEASSQEEKETAYDRIDQKIGTVSRGAASGDFMYDRKNNRIRYRPILDRIKGYNPDAPSKLYTDYIEKFFPHYGITVEDIYSIKRDVPTTIDKNPKSSQKPINFDINLRTN